jgi:hypothetical protein
LPYDVSPDRPVALLDVYGYRAIVVTVAWQRLINYALGSLVDVLSNWITKGENNIMGSGSRIWCAGC